MGCGINVYVVVYVMCTHTDGVQDVHVCDHGHVCAHTVIQWKSPVYIYLNKKLFMDRSDYVLLLGNDTHYQYRQTMRLFFLLTLVFHSSQF